MEAPPAPERSSEAFEQGTPTKRGAYVHDEKEAAQDEDAAAFDYWVSNGDEVPFRL